MDFFRVLDCVARMVLDSTECFIIITIIIFVWMGVLLACMTATATCVLCPRDQTKGLDPQSWSYKGL